MVDVLHNTQELDPEPENWDVVKRSCQRMKLLDMFADALRAECPEATTKYAKLYRFLRMV